MFRVLVLPAKYKDVSRAVRAWKSWNSTCLWLRHSSCGLPFAIYNSFVSSSASGFQRVVAFFQRGWFLAPRRPAAPSVASSSSLGSMCSRSRSASRCLKRRSQLRSLVRSRSRPTLWLLSARSRCRPILRYHPRVPFVSFSPSRGKCLECAFWKGAKQLRLETSRERSNQSLLSRRVRKLLLLVFAHF